MNKLHPRKDTTHGQTKYKGKIFGDKFC